MPNIQMFTIMAVFCLLGMKEIPAEKPAKRIDAETFFRSRQKTDFRLSPNGEYLAFIGTSNGHNNIFLRRIGQTVDLPVTQSGTDINTFLWGTNDFILYLQDTEGDENFRLFRIDIRSGEKRCLTNHEKAQTNLLSQSADSEGNILIAMNLRDPELFDPYRLNIRNGDMRLLYENPGDIRWWVSDHTGTVRFARSNVLLYRKDSTSAFEEIMALGSEDVFDPRCFTKDSRHVYAYSNIGRDKTAIVEYDPDERKEVRVLFDNSEYDAFGDDERDFLIYSQTRKDLLFARFTGEKRELVFFDTTLAHVYQTMKRKIGGQYEINLSSISDDLTRYVLHVSSDRLEGVYYFYDDRTHELKELSRDSPWLDENEMAEMKSVRFKARDGFLLQGYLTLPKGVSPHGLPLVVNPHAGPQWRNSWIFDLKTQFLANRGYAVLQVNFRGSTGYGKEFLRAGFKQWGLRIQDDITDGVRWLIDQGLVDKSRIAIYGGSFGGYASLAGVTFTPDLYACGIDLWGISNYFTLCASFPPYWKSYLKQIHERWGDPVRDSVQMYQTSPVFHVDKVKAPLLIFQGANDVRVKRGQSDEMVEALRRHKKEVEYILLEGVGHGVSDEQKQILQMKRIDEFLAKHMSAGRSNDKPVH